MSEMTKPEKHLGAWTAHQYKTPGGPPYINVRQVGSMCRITVRGESKDNGDLGDAVVFTVNAWSLGQIAKELTAASSAFEPGLDTDPKSFA